MTQHPEEPGQPADERQAPSGGSTGDSAPSPAGWEHPSAPDPANRPGPQQYSQSPFDGVSGSAGHDPSHGQAHQAGPNQYGQPGQQGPYGQPSYGQQQPPYGYQQPPHGHQPPHPQGGGPSGAPLSASDERLWGTLAHISIPFIGFVGPLIAYLVFKDRSAWLKATSTEALNFSLLYTAAQFVCGLLVSVGIGAVLLPLVFVAGIVLCVLAAIAANKGEQYKYPVNWRLIT